MAGGMVQLEKGRDNLFSLIKTFDELVAHVVMPHAVDRGINSTFTDSTGRNHVFITTRNEFKQGAEVVNSNVLKQIGAVYDYSDDYKEVIQNANDCFFSGELVFHGCVFFTKYFGPYERESMWDLTQLYSFDFLLWVSPDSEFNVKIHVERSVGYRSVWPTSNTDHEVRCQLKPTARSMVDEFDEIFRQCRLQEAERATARLEIWLPMAKVQAQSDDLLTQARKDKEAAQKKLSEATASGKRKRIQKQVDTPDHDPCGDDPRRDDPRRGYGYYEYGPAPSDQDMPGPMPSDPDMPGPAPRNSNVAGRGGRGGARNARGGRGGAKAARGGRCGGRNARGGRGGGRNAKGKRGGAAGKRAQHRNEWDGTDSDACEEEEKSSSEEDDDEDQDDEDDAGTAGPAEPRAAGGRARRERTPPTPPMPEAGAAAGPAMPRCKAGPLDQRKAKLVRDRQAKKAAADAAAAAGGASVAADAAAAAGGASVAAAGEIIVLEDTESDDEGQGGA